MLAVTGWRVNAGVLLNLQCHTRESMPCLYALLHLCGVHDLYAVLHGSGITAPTLVVVQAW